MNCRVLQKCFHICELLIKSNKILFSKSNSPWSSFSSSKFFFSDISRTSSKKYCQSYLCNCSRPCSSSDVAYEFIKMIYKTTSIFDNANSVTIKATFIFLEFVSAFKKSSQFNTTFLRHSRF